MLFASLTDVFNQSGLILIMFVAACIQLGKMFCASNPDVKDAAKKAVSSTAINFLSRWMK
jgi:hypothetical protein